MPSLFGSIQWCGLELPENEMDESRLSGSASSFGTIAGRGYYICAVREDGGLLGISEESCPT